MLRPAASVIKSVAPSARAQGYVEAVDGSSSAPESGPEALELRPEGPRPSHPEREPDELRARASGPDADIEADPAAMARLVELEAAHLAAATAVRAGGSAVGAAPVPAAGPAGPTGDPRPAPADPPPGAPGAAAAAGVARVAMARAIAVCPAAPWFCAVVVVFMFCLHTGLIGIPGSARGTHTPGRRALEKF